MSGAGPIPGDAGGLPRLAFVLGFAGLLPQVAAVAALLAGDGGWRFTALALAYAYAALILSFLGGLWWGLAAARPALARRWMWVAAVMPSLVGLVSAIPWTIGAAWPQPSLLLLGSALIAALAVDVRMVAAGMCPPGWLGLRLPLSLGLGALTIAAALI